MLNSPQNGRSTCPYNHSYNLHQKFVFLLQPTFTFSISRPYLFPKPSLQFPPILPPSITQQLLSFLFFHTAIHNIFSKNFFPTLTIEAIQAASKTKEQGSLMRTDISFSVLWKGKTDYWLQLLIPYCSGSENCFIANSTLCGRNLWSEWQSIHVLIYPQLIAIISIPY